MSGWDSDDDGLMDIHTKDIGISVSLANVMLNTVSLYKLPLKPVVYNPGSGGSDHGSFWYHDYSAICFSEAYWGDDFNPYSESNEDRIDKFNLEYYHNICKLGIVTLSTLAKEYVVSSVESDILTSWKFSLFQNYPNPFNPSTTISYNIPLSVMLNSFQHLGDSKIPNQLGDNNVIVTLKVYDILGREISTLVNQKQKPGNYEVEFSSHSGEGRNLPSGIYIYELRAGEFFQTKKMLLIK
jgi:hypothetical protein